MNVKLLLPATIACLLLTSSFAPAQTVAAGSVDPSTGLPVAAPQNAPHPAPAPVPNFDPNTGLPTEPPPIDPVTGLPPEPQWIDPNWSDPGITVDDIGYDGLPLSEVVRHLRAVFKDKFNILPLPQTFGQDWGTTIIHLQLKNVKASEVFNAMNLVFENDRTPIRWELKNSAYGGLSYAQLRVLPQAAHWMASGGVGGAIVDTPPAPKQRMVYYIGNLVGDEKSGGMNIDQVAKTILNVWPKELGDANDILQFHNEAQLLVVYGTPDQIAFIHQTLKALQEKVEATLPKNEANKGSDINHGASRYRLDTK
jgi:hypothetical protein